MGMTWEEYKTYREKRKKEEKNKKKQESSNKKSVKQDISQSNQSTVQNNRNSLSNILNNGNNLNFTNNNNPLLSLQDRKQEAIKQIQDSANSKKNYSNSNNKTSLWDRIKNIAGDIERIDQNIGEGISSGLKDLGGMIFRARQKEIIQRDSTFLHTAENNETENTNDWVTKTLTKSVNKAKENIDNFDTKRMEERAKSQKKIAENISKQSNSVTKKIAELSPSIGNMGVGMVASAVNPIAGAAYFTGSAAGSYYYDAIDRGMTKEQAEKYGMIMGSLEGITEMIGVKNIQKGGKIVKTLVSGGGKTALKAATSETVKTGTKEALKKFGIGVADNFMQESIMELLQERTAQTIGGKDKANWENMGKRMLQSGIDGALTSIIMSGAEAGSNTCIGLAEKAQKGKKITQQEAQQAVKDAEKVGVDTKKVAEENLLRERDKIINEMRQSEQNQNVDSKIINQETKTPQNATSQAETQAKTQTSSNLDKVRQFYDENTFNQMKQFIETAPSQEALNQINEDIKTETKNKLEEAYKSENFKESQNRKRTYAKYQRENNTNGIQYNTDVVNNALDTVAANRNGRRTVGQWKQVAEQIGLEASDLSKSEIDNIAYGSWFELQPTKNITKYDNRTKEHKGFEKFTSDDWVNTIYESAKGQKLQKLDTVLSSDVANSQEMLYNNSNESESDVNGQIQSRGMAGVSEQLSTSISEENTSKQRKFTKAEYEQYEKSIKPIEQSKLTDKQREQINNYKRQYGKDIVFFDGDSNQEYYGGASLTDKNKIYVDRNSIEKFGENKVINHEIMESNIRHNRELSDDVIQPAIEKIINDENFENQKQLFWNSEDGDMPSDYAIAKELLCDRFAELKTGEEWDYRNVLSKETNMTIDYAIKNFNNKLDEGIIKESAPTRVQSSESLDSSVDTIDNVSTSNNSIPQNKQNIKDEVINWNEIERPENNQKFRKHYRSIIESSNTTAEAKAISKELMGKDTYVPETNKGQLAQADQRIMTSSPETELQSLLSRAMNGEKISSVDIAVGERLIQYFSKTGSKQQLQEAIQATAMAGTSAGQTVQALSMLNHQTPQGQATWIQRSVDKMNKELAKKKGGTITTDVDGNLQVINKQGVDITDKVDLFNLTPEMVDKIMNSENQEQMYKNIDEVYKELGQQVPKSMLEKVDSWRYFSMLANARTHIRNMVGNQAMGKTQRIKDKLAGGIEDIVSKFNPEMERTKTLKLSDKKTKEFAKNDFKNMEVQSRLELNENKYNPQSRLQNARRTFKSNAMENTLGRLFDLNDNLLAAEDGIGLKAGYQKALADYITANKIDVDKITDTQLNKARNYAIQQAKEATFHQANAIASAITQFQNKNNVTKFFVDALLPFKKTPMNVAKAGIEYSPLQIAKSATLDVVNLRKGNISINQYIDNLSKGMTGTGIALAGYALAKAGILKASGGDDKDKEKYDEEQGKQSYSIEIAGKTYSLDWLAPTGIPLFIGAETFKLYSQEDTEKSTEKSSEEDKLNQAIKGASNLLNAGATAINPMSEMSMISGLTSALSSYNTSDNLGSLGNMMTNMGKSYVNQFFPTLMGQVAKTGDEYERTTKSTAKGTIGKAVDQTINQIKNKVPGLRQTLPIKTDIWGKEVKQEVNLPLRAINNFVNPATVKQVSTDKVDMELNKLYEENHNASILPDILTKTVQLNKQTYRLSNKEYAEFTKNYGQTSHNLIESFIKTGDYNKLTQEQKETAIANIYSYAKEKNKLDYAEKVNEEVKPSTLYSTMKEIEKGGGKQSEYLNYLAKTKGMSKESEKNKVLANSSYSNKTKEIIYRNGTGKDDDLYNNLLSKSNINMTEYLDYKNKVSEKAFSSDKDKNGKTIIGSAKKKVIDYLNNNISGSGNRLLIAGKSYALQNNEKQKLAQYINQIASTKEERLAIYNQLDKNFTVKDGKVYMRVSKK